MKVLLCHNYYQLPGGEDQVFAAEGQLLTSHGHEVVTYTKHNAALHGMGRWAMARTTWWNRDACRELRALIRQERPDVMHCTNLFPLISPAAYAAARSENVPVVQSLHNYRLLCPQAQFVRAGRPCEQCLGKWLPWPGIVHRCYRDSRGASSVVAAMLALHRLRGTWLGAVDRYIALTEFSRRKFIQGGLPAEKLAVKPNFVVSDGKPGHGDGGYALFLGRLSREKGVDTLLAAWDRLGETIPLRIVGDGPLAEHVQVAAARNQAVQWLGHRPHREVADLLGGARFLVFPSRGYETFGLSIIEAFAKGTPVIASRLGAMGELVEQGRTGWHVQPADADDLAQAVRLLWTDEHLLARLRTQARQEFETKYTAERNYQLLIGIYEQSLEQTRRRTAAQS